MIWSTVLKKVNNRETEEYNIAEFNLPKKFIVMAELPKNNAGKLLKREIRNRYGAKL